VSTPDLPTYPAIAALVERFAARDADWRLGPVVYHVFVDRFAPSADLAAKRALYDAPRTLHGWEELPVRGVELPELGLWSHELAFWGGDLESLRGRLDHIAGLDVDVVYLNPICDALTNHKYDANDYAAVSPEYGTREDVIALADDLHARGMRLMLDGVFNHMGRTAPIFQEALRDPSSPYRSWFEFDDEHPLGYRGWAGVGNLPEVRLENPAVREAIWGSPDSVVQRYLRDGVDGWRLDVAFEIGFEFLTDLTAAAHRARPDSVVIGEVWNYPDMWSPALDAVMNFHTRALVFGVLDGGISPASFNRLQERLVADCGIEHLLKAWLILDNHDTERLNHLLPDPRGRRLAKVLQVTLPGAPLIYYGTEAGMEGGYDPECRAPMRWDLITEDNEELAFSRHVLAMRKRCRALRIGDYRALDAAGVIAFSRQTDVAGDSVFVLVNPTDRPVRELISTRDARVMNGAILVDELGGPSARIIAGIIPVDLPPWGVAVYRPDVAPVDGYTPFKRVR
jgi:glycosidase